MPVIGKEDAKYFNWLIHIGYIEGFFIAIRTVYPSNQ